MKALVQDAGAIAHKRFGKDGVHKVKSERIGDVVTKADMATERFIVGKIKRAYPSHGIIAEEGSSTNMNAEYIWTIDPIDGTANFAVGAPLFGVMVSLSRRGKGLMAATYMPALGELFFAQAGKGAYLNNKRIHCANTPKLSRSFGMASLSVRPRNAKFMKRLFAGAATDQIKLGAFSSTCVNASYVAAGRRDWFVQLAAGQWDFAPVALILKESGCKVSDSRGKDWELGMTEMVAANPQLHKQLIELTKSL